MATLCGVSDQVHWWLLKSDASDQVDWWLLKGGVADQVDWWLLNVVSLIW